MLTGRKTPPAQSICHLPAHRKCRRRRPSSRGTARARRPRAERGGQREPRRSPGHRRRWAPRARSGSSAASVQCRAGSSPPSRSATTSATSVPTDGVTRPTGYRRYAVSPAALTGAAAGAAAEQPQTATRARAALVRRALWRTRPGHYSHRGRGSDGKFGVPGDGEASPHGASPAKPIAPHRTGATSPAAAESGAGAACLAADPRGAPHRRQVGSPPVPTIGPGAPGGPDAGRTLGTRTSARHSTGRTCGTRAFSGDVASGIVISAEPCRQRRAESCGEADGYHPSPSQRAGSAIYWLPTLAGTTSRRRRRQRAWRRSAKASGLGPIPQAYSDTVARGRFISTSTARAHRISAAPLRLDRDQQWAAALRCAKPGDPSRTQTLAEQSETDPDRG